ncbi:hypothetical protein GLOIN_2v1762669 [Rhizophagus irregularis DAOM 181602=DAOM 197198]|nr:hypothetical protein GLOIN_2v1762669 [Rhizophagus irregularis DAOM 181602=DAOM 197198]
MPFSCPVANSISELSDSQIQTIVDYFSKNPNTELPDDRDGTIIDFEEDILNDQDNVLVSVTRVSLKKLDAKTLDQYPNLYREFSSEDFDYYGINDETLCPLCKLDHDDEEGIDGMYKSESYFIKCEQREIEITA